MTVSLTGISSMATRQLLAGLADRFQRDTGHRVVIHSVGGVNAARRVRAGEPFDFVVLARAVMNHLATEGHFSPDDLVDVARSGIAAAVPANQARPSVADEEAVKQAILAARAVCYSTGPSGDHVKRLWDRWGIAAAVTPKAILAPPGVPVASILARGEADLGFQQLSELLHSPGVDVLGALPSSIQLVTTFAASVTGLAKYGEEARTFIRFANSDQAYAVIVNQGMEPAV